MAQDEPSADTCDALDVVGCSDALAASVVEERRVAARRLALTAHWADLHGPGTADGPDGSSGRSWGPRMVPGGADGTPMVGEFAADELGLLLGTTTRSAARRLAEALNLRHRHPALWEAVHAGRVEAWKAGQVARAAAVLNAEQARLVDQETVAAVIGLPFGRAMSVVEGRIVAADPAGHDARRAAARSERVVRVGRRDATGLQTIFARSTVAEITRLDSMITHLARVLAAHGDSEPLPARRTKALALLANPALACVLIAAPIPASEPTGEQPANAVLDSVPRFEADEELLVPRDVDASPEDEDPPSPQDDRGHPGGGAVALAAVFGRLLTAGGSATLDRLRPRSVVYLHLHHAALVGASGAQVARVEDLGPMSRAQLAETLGEDLTGWLGLAGDRLSVSPVLDIAGQEPLDGYEVPDRLRDAVTMAHPYEVFPWGTGNARACDLDHTRPYRPRRDSGPPGQTRLGNLGPLSRHHHRAKTHGGFSVRQPRPGTFLWRTPTGHHYRVDARGTTPLGRTVAGSIDTGTSSAAEAHLGRLLSDFAAA